MNARIKIGLRTLQTLFPGLLEAKFRLMRAYRNALHRPFDPDFKAIGLFPESDKLLFLDVGANRGQSADAIMMLSKKSSVYMFEPNPLLCEKLEVQYRREPRVLINRFGLGDVELEQDLYVPFYKRWMFDGLASFDKDKAMSWFKGRMLCYKESHISTKRVKCQIRRLDDLSLNPFFIKLDVQGYELQALRGGARTISASEPVLLIESPPEDEVVCFLKEFGYRSFAFDGFKFLPGRIGGRNTFFMTEAKTELVRPYVAATPLGRAVRV